MIFVYVAHLGDEAVTSRGAGPLSRGTDTSQYSRVLPPPVIILPETPLPVVPPFRGGGTLYEGEAPLPQTPAVQRSPSSFRGVRPHQLSALLKMFEMPGLLI